MSTQQPKDPSSMLERMWHRNRNKWTQSRPWLGAAYQRNPETNQKQFVLGCYLCFACGDFAAGNKFGKFSMSNWPFDAHLLDQHVATATHRRALGVLEARALAPSMPQFLKVLNAYRNKAGTRPVEDVARREKSRKMLFCLAESIMRSADRVFLRKANVATISQDVRKSRLLVRFRAAYLDASGALQLRAGILGQTRVPEGGALNLYDATLRVFQEFCTIQQAPLSSKSAGRLDGKLLERLLTIVRFFVADAASDEQAAGTDFQVL